jgi:hypothetical protein
MRSISKKIHKRKRNRKRNRNRNQLSYSIVYNKCAYTINSSNYTIVYRNCEYTINPPNTYTMQYLDYNEFMNPSRSILYRSIIFRILRFIRAMNKRKAPIIADLAFNGIKDLALLVIDYIL